MNKNNVLKHDSIPVINEHLMKGIMIGLLVAFAASVISLFGNSASTSISVNGFKLVLRPADFILIIAALILCFDIYNFYKLIICNIGETIGENLLSFFGMLLVFMASIIGFLDNVFPYRFALIFCISIAVYWKNAALAKRLEGTAIGGKFKHWANRAKFACMIFALAAVLFYIMFDGDINQHWLKFLVDGNDLAFNSNYYLVAPIFFYTPLLLFAGRLYYLDSSYFASQEFNRDIESVKSGV